MQKNTLTVIQQKILNYIRKSLETYGVPPSIKEIGSEVGLSSSSSVHHQLKALEEKGYIRREQTKSRCISLTEKSGPPAKPGSAGPPAPEAAAKPETPQERPQAQTANRVYPLVRFDENFRPVYLGEWSLPLAFTGTEDAFLFAVDGNEMAESGILHGDICIIEYMEDPADGETVLALTEDRLLLRVLKKRSDCFLLATSYKSLNWSMHKQLAIIGRLRGIMRNG